MKINFRTRGRGFNVGSTYSIPAVDGLPSYFENFSVSMIYLPGHKWTVLKLMIPIDPVSMNSGHVVSTVGIRAEYINTQRSVA